VKIMISLKKNIYNMHTLNAFKQIDQVETDGSGWAWGCNTRLTVLSFIQMTVTCQTFIRCVYYNWPMHRRIWEPDSKILQFYPCSNSYVTNKQSKRSSFMLYCFAPTSFSIVIEVSTVSNFVPVIVRYIDQAYNQNMKDVAKLIVALYHF